MDEPAAALRARIVRARLAALVGVAVGGAIAAVTAGYVAIAAPMLEGSGRPETLVFAAAFGAIPLLLGLPILVTSALRLRLLGRALHRPQDVTSAELAMRFGRPAVRLRFPGGRAVAVQLGDLDGNTVVTAVRARRGHALPEARVVVRQGERHPARNLASSRDKKVKK
jgi:hypothetical protein